MLLTTPRLRLREFEPDDWSAVLAYQSDPRYLRYYHWTERTAADVQVFVGNFLTHQQAQPRLKRQLAIILPTTGQLIGSCGIRLDTADAINGDIGYENEYFKGRYWDTLMFAVLEDEWRARQP